MATSAPPTSSAFARGNSVHSSLGTVAPLNTPTRRFYGTRDQTPIRQPGVPNPNVYVVQPFKNASVPKDLVYAKKNAPNPAEGLLNSTVELISHFTSCYEAVKHQLQDEHAKERESALNSTSMTLNGTTRTISRSNPRRPTKQAKLQPLIVHQKQPMRQGEREPTIKNCVGISPVPAPKADDLVQIYDEKLRLLRRLKPELFDAQGNLLSRNLARSSSYSQVSVPSSKKSAASSFRTPYNTLLTTDNVPFDERRTFLTEYTHEDYQDSNNNKDEQNHISFSSAQQTNSLHDYVKSSYVLKILEIKTVASSNSNYDRNKSASDKGSFHSHQGNLTTKSA